jgi:glucose/arabinose dehydrogenase
MSVPENFSSSTFLSGINQPMGMTWLPDGRVLIIEKPGTIKITDPDEGTKDTATYMDLTGKVNDGRERGFIDITLDPNFEQNGYVYVFYSNDDEDTNRIARFTHQENGGGLQSSADPSTEFVVWKEDEPWKSCCHQGAGLDFGPDGKLWLTTGDDFEGGAVSQNLAKASGKVIRINKDGTIPQDNPYVGDGNPDTLGEIWAYGVRNPFRGEWDLESKRFFFGDVGGNENPDYEEVNVATLDNPGANYGWPACEGTSKSTEDAPCEISQTAPVYSYPHSEGNSITGGEVYRGNQFPTEYQGAYFFGDYAKNWIKYLTFDSNGDVQSVEMFEDSADNVNSISVGPDGALYWTSISDGTITKVTYTGNQAPQIDSVSATPTSAASAPQTVDFNVSASDPEDDPLTYDWTFGDGSTGTGASTSHTYQSAGVYTAYVEVSDGTQTIESQQIEITIGQAPSVSIDSPNDGDFFRGGDTISFSASATDPEDGQLSSDAFTWNVAFDHVPPEGAAHTHPVLSNYQGASGSFDVPTSGHGYSTDTSYTLTVTATDSDGLSASDSVTIEPDKVDITFATDPAGLDLSVDGIPYSGDTVIDTLVDFNHEVSAPTTQCLDGREYEFQGWSDGGAQTHTYTVPDSDSTLTANYQDVGECSVPVADGLVAQYEADQGLSTSGGEVTGWTDQSGQGNDLTAAGDPTTTTAPSGLTAVSFDGSDDKLERTSTLNAFPSGNGDRTVVLVANYESTGYGGFAFGDDSTNNAFGTVVDPDGDLMVQGWGGSNDFDSGVAGTGEGWLIQSATFDGNTLTHYKNGQEIDTVSHSYNTNLQQLVVGAEIDSNPYLDMEVAAAYVYDRSLTDTERQQVESHLQDKYLSQEPTNQNPTASDDSATVDTGQSVTIDVLANDDDPEGNLDPSTVTIDQGPASGTATVNADGSITYTHDGSDTTSDSFVYQVSDDQGAGDAATVSISVDQGTDGGSDVPVQSGLVTELRANAGVTTNGGTVTDWTDQSASGIDLSGEGDPTLVSDGLNGNPVISLDGDDKLVRTGDLTGLPSGDQNRTMFVVTKYDSTDAYVGAAFGDGDGNQAFGTVVETGGQLTVQGWGNQNDLVSDTPGVGAGWLVQSARVSGDQVTHYKDGTRIDSGTRTYATDLDDTDSKFVIGEEINEIGYADMEVAAVLVYDRTLTDTERQQVQSHLQQTYFAENAPPTASDDSATVEAGNSVTINVLSNDEDPDGALNASSVRVTSGPSTGSTSVLSTTGEITYEAPSDASGDVTFTYSVADDDGATDTATVTVSVSGDAGTGTYGVSTGEATNVVINTSTATNAQATLSGSLTLGDKSEATTYVRFWVQGQPETKYWYDGETVTASDDFSIEVVLSPSTTYVWQTLSQSGDGAWKAGAEKTFTTPTGQFFGVDSTGASDVGVESATLNGEILDLGDNDNARVYFTYWKQGQKDSTLTWYTGPVQDAPGAFSAEVGLEPGTTYEYRAFGQSDEGEWKAGPVTTFTTQTGQTYGVATDPATDVGSDSATLIGELTGLGDYDSATVYFQYWKQGQKNSTLNWWTGSSVSSATSFNAGVSGLDSGTTYVVQTYAQSDEGKWTAGSEVTFTTDATATVNDVPTANDDTASVTAGQSTTIDVLANDSDSDGSLNASSVDITTQPSVGSATVESDGTITYGAPSDASGDVTFTYSVADDDGATDTATVTVSVTPPADSSLPVTSGLVTHLEADQGVTTDGDAVTNWTDQSGTGIDLTGEGDPTLVGDGLNGNPVISLDGDDDKLARTGDLSGLPSGDQNRTMFVVTKYDSTDAWVGTAFGNGDDNNAFGLVVEEGSGNLALQGWADDEVTETPGVGAGWMTQSATVENNQFSHYQDGQQIDSGTHAFNTELTADGSKFVIGEEIAQLGYADMEVAAVIVYDRALSDSERQQVQDHLDQKYFTQTANQDPTATNDSASVTAGESTTIDVLANDQDSDGSLDASSVQVTSGSSTGSTSVDASTGAITYSAPSDASGDVTFTYTVEDEDGAVSNEATVTVSITTANEAPTAAFDPPTNVIAGSETTFDASTSTDADGSIVQYAWDFDGDGAVDQSTSSATTTYTYASAGTYQANLTVTDDDGATNTTIQTVTVEQPNSAPTANDDSASVDAGQSTTIDVLTNDTDSDGSLNTSSVSIVSQPSNGTVSVDSATGEVTYTHDGSDTTSDSFTYTVADNDGATSNEATVSITVNQQTSSAPVTNGLVTHLEADQGVTTSNGQVTGWADQSGTGTDLTGEGDPTLVSDGLNGQPVISLDGDGDKLVRTGDLTGLPSGDQNRTMVVVTKYDNANAWAGTAFGNGDNNQAFGLIVKGGSGALTVQGWGNDLVSGTQGSGAGWLVQSATVAGDQVTHYKDGTQIQSGSKTYDTTLDASGSKFVIGEEIAQNGYNDMEIAAVLVYDRALSDTERQQVKAYLDQKYLAADDGTNAAPTANNDSASVTAGQSVTIDVLANDTDSDGTLNASSVVVTSQPATGTTTVNADGTITYDAPSDASGDVTFGYTVADDDGAVSNEATVTATVNATQTQPSLVTDGLVTHLAADQGVTTSNGNVTGWADQSGQGNDLTASGDPVLVQDGINGQPVISLDGNGDKLARNSALNGLPSGDQNRTMFVVTKYDGASAYAGTAFGNGASNEAFGLVVNGGSGKLTVQGWGSGNDLVSGTQATGTGWLVQSAAVTGDQVTHYKNGQQIDSGSRTYATNLQKFVIGEEIANAGYADMEIAAVLVYDRALTDTERQQVEAYLEDEYAVGT